MNDKEAYEFSKNDRSKQRDPLVIPVAVPLTHKDSVRFRSIKLAMRERFFKKVDEYKMMHGCAYKSAYRAVLDDLTEDNIKLNARIRRAIVQLMNELEPELIAEGLLKPESSQDQSDKSA